MIDKYSDIPLYFQLKEELIKNIKNGVYKPGDPIPSENELCRIYSLSRPTVRQAIGELSVKGFLTKIKGKGTYVSDILTRHKISHERGFMHTALGCNDTKERNIIDVETVDSTYRINGKPITDYFKIEYIPNVDNRFVKSEFTFGTNDIIAYTVSFLPERYFPDSAKHMRKNMGSLELIGTRYPYEPIHSKCKLYVINSEEKESQSLNIPFNTPVIVIENSLQGRNQNIVEFSLTYYSSLTTDILFMKSRKV